MRNRREFIRTAVSVAAGTLITGRELVEGAVQVPQAGAPVARREVRVGGKCVKVVDAHAHASIAEVHVSSSPIEKVVLRHEAQRHIRPRAEVDRLIQYTVGRGNLDYRALLAGT